MDAKLILGGRWVQTQVKGSMMGLSTEGVAMDGYDNVTGEEDRQHEEEKVRINEHVCSFVRGDPELARAECREGEVDERLGNLCPTHDCEEQWKTPG